MTPVSFCLRNTQSATPFSQYSLNPVPDVLAFREVLSD